MKIQLEALDLEAAVRTYLVDQGLDLENTDTLFEYEGTCAMVISPKSDEDVQVLEKPVAKKKRKSRAKKAEPAPTPEPVEEEVKEPEVVVAEVEAEVEIVEPVVEKPMADTPSDVGDIFGTTAGNTVEEETAAVEEEEAGEDASALFV